jgi:hypothetical protein
MVALWYACLFLILSLWLIEHLGLLYRLILPLASFMPSSNDISLFSVNFDQSLILFFLINFSTWGIVPAWVSMEPLYSPPFHYCEIGFISSLILRSTSVSVVCLAGTCATPDLCAYCVHDWHYECVVVIYVKLYSLLLSGVISVGFWLSFFHKLYSSHSRSLWCTVMSCLVYLFTCYMCALSLVFGNMYTH